MSPKHSQYFGEEKKQIDGWCLTSRQLYVMTAEDAPLLDTWFVKNFLYFSSCNPSFMSGTVTSTKGNPLGGPDHSATEWGQCPAQHTLEGAQQAAVGEGARSGGGEKWGHSHQKFSEKQLSHTHLGAAAEESLWFLINTNEVAFLVQNEDGER